jgi:hypothetical protein
MCRASSANPRADSPVDLGLQKRREGRERSGSALPIAPSDFHDAERRLSMGLRLLRIATYNVNGINGRLPVLLAWLKEFQPDFVCLQELKAPQERFPVAAIRDTGYETVWHGPVELEWGRNPGARCVTARDLPRPARRSERSP